MRTWLIMAVREGCTVLLDITLPVTPAMRSRAPEKEDHALAGHLGTHFDVMDKEFPLIYTCREGIVFDVCTVRGRDIDLSDVSLEWVKEGHFVAFYTGYIEEEPYGTKTYFAQHPQLSHALIEALLDKRIAIIGMDCAGVRRGREHTPTDQRCADRGVFVVENLCGLGAVASVGKRFTVHTYPVNYTGMSGLPCRVLVEI